MQPLAKLPPTTAKPDTLAIRIKKRRRILSVSGALVVLAIGDFLIMRGAGEIEPPLVRGWRLFLTCLLALYLARGTNSARWFTVLLTTLATLVGFVAVTLLVVTDILGPSFRYLIVWLGFLTFAYAILSAFLSFSPGVAREIRRLENETKEE